MAEELMWVRCYPNGKREYDYLLDTYSKFPEEKEWAMQVWELFRIQEKDGRNVGLYKIKRGR